jgi:uridine kinase
MPEITLDEITLKMKDPKALVDLDEKNYIEKITDVAKRVCDNKEIRVILLAGPSASGKTTTANLIADRIRELGERSAVVSLDNFYKDAADPTYPRLPDGERDLESPYALDLDLLISTLADIISGKEFSVPKYDFKVGGKVGAERYPSFAEGCVIIEGIHGLNPIISDPFPRESVLKVFVSVSTNINHNGRRILSGRKLRFVRRLVRDNLYRASDAKRTLDMWDNVLVGEDKYLYPYKNLADIRFDTFHTFEPGVMKHYAMKLLTPAVTKENGYAMAVADAMEKMPELDEAIVPESSLIREFIPGGIYEHLY